MSAVFKLKAAGPTLMSAGQPENQSLHVGGTVGKISCSWLVDTGAAVTCISASLPGINVLEIRPTFRKPIGANGLPLSCVGTITADVGIGPTQVSHVPIIVVKDLSAPAIIGMDVLSRFSSFSVDLDARLLHLGGHRLQLEARQHGLPTQPVSVRLLQDCVVEPHSERVVYVGADDFGSWPREVVFDPDPERASRYGVASVPCFVRSDVGNRMPILIHNPGAESVKMYGNSVMGQITAATVEENAERRKPRREGRAEVDISEADIGDTDRKKLQRLLNEYRDVFANNEEELGRTHMATFKIITTDGPPVAVRPRRTPYHLRDEVRRQVASMEARGIIRPSVSPWSAPILMVRKTDNSYRFAIDYRGLNDRTVEEVAYLPTVKECLDSLSGSSVFSTLDLNSAYWQVPVAEEDRQKTAFCTEDSKWEFLVMPYGAKGAPSCFTRLMSVVLRGLLGNGVTAYMDDVVVGGRTVAEHLTLLQAVLERLRKAGLTVKSRKVVVCRRRVRVLGHVVSGSTVQPDPERVEAIKGWPSPKTTKQVRQFLGMCTYYNDFVPQLQLLAAPLHELSGKSRFYWDEHKELAFQRMKQALCEATTLQLPDMQRDFEVSTDASDTGLGCILSQRDDAGVERPICFASKSFTHSEQNWHIRDKEVFALIFAIRKFRHYLLGRQFHWYTDHFGLQWLHNTKDPRGRYARWIEELEEFQFSIHFRRAEENAPADALSRAQVCGAAELPVSAYPDTEVPSVEELRMAQQHDERLSTLCSELRLRRRDGQMSTQWRAAGYEPTLDPVSGLVLASKGRKQFVMVPQSLIPQILELKHDKIGHFGSKKTRQMVIQAGYIWQGMSADIKNYCRSCVTCAVSNDPPRRFRAPLQLTTQATSPWQHVAVDLMGPFGRSPTRRGNRFVLVALDLLTKSVELAALPCKSAETVCQALVEVLVYRHGIPESLLTDRGLEFENKHFKLLASALGIDKKRISSFHPQSNGAVERVNQTIGSLLRKRFQECGADWDMQLNLVRFQYMSSPHSTTGRSPFFLQYGREPRTPELIKFESGATGHTTEASWAKNLVADLNKAHEEVVAREQQLKEARVRGSCSSGHVVQYKAGDRVFMKIPPKPGTPGKLQARWSGPFIIVQCRQGNTYLIKKEDNFRQRFLRHHDQLKPVEPREDHLQASNRTADGRGLQDRRPSPTKDQTQQGKSQHPGPVTAPKESIPDADEDEVDETEDEDGDGEDDSDEGEPVPHPDVPARELRRSTRERKPPDRLGEWTV